MVRFPLTLFSLETLTVTGIVDGNA
jgi:hypothetical protein